MTLTSLEAIISALNEAHVRYLIVGGLAVAAHGYARLTLDVDLVVHLDEANVVSALDALRLLNYKPIIPVSAQDFASPEKRSEWTERKQMVVFSMRSDDHPYTPIDIFLKEPFDFEMEYARAFIGDIAPGVSTRFVALDTLIRMKEAVSRPKDQEDVRQLRLLKDADSDK
jgi:hypothetical protein